MKKATILALLLLSPAGIAPASAQTTASAPDLVSVDVTVVNHRPGPAPEIARDDVVARQDGAVRPVVGWEPLTGAHAGIDLAVLIDDSLPTGISLQWKDVGQFIGRLPAGSRIAIVYGTASEANMVQPFTADRRRAIEAMRLPAGAFNEGSSIYLSLQSLLKRWPEGRNRRLVLMLSDGIDLFYGVAESAPGLNQSLDGAIDLARKKGVQVDPIFVNGASRLSRNPRLVLNGQSCLALLGQATGGVAFTGGFESSVDMTPLLDQIADRLQHQYRLTFRAKLPPRPGYARLNLTAEQRGVELRAVPVVYLPVRP